MSVSFSRYFVFTNNVVVDKQAGRTNSMTKFYYER